MSILCMESGGTKLVAASADRQGRLQQVVRRQRRADQRAGETLGMLIEMGREVCREAAPPEAASFGFGGLVRRSDCRAHLCFHEEGWSEIDARQVLADAFQVPVFIENDCKLAGLGEAHCGWNFLDGVLFYATIGTGIGGATISRGRLLEMGPLGEAEIGHCIVDENGPPCPCGNHGCLEALCAGPALEGLAQSFGLTTDVPSLMESYRQKDALARQVVQRAARYLGQAFGTVVNLIQPQLIVLGGGVMKSNRAFLETIARHTESFVFPPFRAHYRFELSRLEETAVCQGAALYAAQRLGSVTK